MINRIAFACLAVAIFAIPAQAVTLKWDQSTGTVDGYRIYIDRTQVAQIASDVPTEYDLGELVEGETHVYGVSAFNSAGESQPAELQFTYEPTQTIVFPNVPRTLTLIFNESASQ